MTVSLDGAEYQLSATDLSLVSEATDMRLLDLNDGFGTDLQAYVPRLGGWTNLATFAQAA